jgi:hypothetical protein
LHGWVRPHFLAASAAQNLADVKHHDAVTLLHDEIDVVLDKQYRASQIAAEILNTCGEPVALGMVQTRVGFV